MARSVTFNSKAIIEFDHPSFDDQNETLYAKIDASMDTIESTRSIRYYLSILTKIVRPTESTGERRREPLIERGCA
jgi:hypothetical protein